MNNKAIQSEIKHHLVKQDFLQKQSGFIKSWKATLVVLTKNYLFTFEGKQYSDPTDVIEISLITALKSNTPEPNEKQIQTFTVQTYWHNLNFRCKFVPDKWNWIVAFERVIDLKVRGATTYNCPNDLQNKGLSSINQFNREYPDGPNGKRLGSNMIDLIQQVYQVGHQQFKKAKKLSEQKISQKQQQEQTKQNQSLNNNQLKEEQFFCNQQQVQKVDEGVQCEMMVQNLVASQRKYSQQNPVKVFKIPSLFNGIFYQDIKDDIEHKQKQMLEQSTQATETEEMIQIKDKLYRKVTKVEFRLVEVPQNVISTSSEDKQTGTISKDKIQHDGIQPQTKQQFSQMQKKGSNQIMLGKVNPEYITLNHHQYDYIKKSKFVISIFDQLSQSASEQSLKLFTEFIIQLMCQDSCKYRDPIKFQCYNHRNKNHFTEVFTEYLQNISVQETEANEQKIENMLRFFSIIYPNSENLFSLAEIEKLKKAFCIFLKDIKTQQIIILTLNNLKLITTKGSFTEEQTKLIDEKEESLKKKVQKNQEQQQQSKQTAILRQF